MRETVSLDGVWQVIFDHDNKGRVLGWQNRDAFEQYFDIEEVPVPSCLEEYKLDYEGVAWYGKSVRVPEEWRGRSVRLCFDAVNYRAEVWINGEAAGAHEGGYIGFDLQIEDLLLPGQENFIVVRVITPIITRDVVIDGLGHNEMPHWRGAITGGIWQSVRLVSTGSTFVERTFVTGNIRSGEANLELTLFNSSMHTQTVDLVSAIIPLRGSEAVDVRESVALRPGRNILRRSMVVPDHQLWSLDDPALYELRTTIGSEPSDQVSTRFGFREFTVEGRHFVLNGERILLKTVFSEAFYPHSLAYPRDIDLLKEEFRLIKEGNINMVRPWRKPQPSIVYDIADEMGILFVGALPVECMEFWPQITPYTRQRIQIEVTEMVLRDRNHPSIVIWEMFNEILRLGLRRLRHSTSLAARELDGSRMIIDESGGFAEPCRVYLPGSFDPSEINEVHDYPSAPLAKQQYENLLLLGKTEEELEAKGRTIGHHTESKILPGLLTNISELGYGSIPDLEANMERYLKEGNPITPDYRMHRRLLDSYLAVFEEAKLSEVFPTFHDFVMACQEIHYTGNKLMAEACRINPDIAGIGIHALNDGDWVLGAGLIDLFRAPKRSYYAIKEVFADLYLAIRPVNQSVYAGEESRICITSVNDNDDVDGEITITVTSAEGREIHAEKRGVTIQRGISDLFEFTLATAGVTGNCGITVTFTASGRSEYTNTSGVYVLDESRSNLPSASVVLVGGEGAFGEYLRSRGASVEQFQKRASARVALFDLGAWDGKPSALLREIWQWVDNGGSAVYLGTPSEEQTRSASRHLRHLDPESAFPFAVSYCRGKTTWVPSSHIVKEHPVYDGLPSNCIMGQEYREVYSHWSVETPKTQWISGNVTYGWYGGLKHKQNYLGVGEAFHGADTTVVPHGSGRFVMCTHRLTGNLGSDPVAERLLANLIRWADES